MIIAGHDFVMETQRAREMQSCRMLWTVTNQYLWLHMHCSWQVGTLIAIRIKSQSTIELVVLLPGPCPTFGDLKCPIQPYCKWQQAGRGLGM